MLHKRPPRTEISFALSNLVNNKQKENIDGIQDYDGSKEIRERNECEQHDYQPFFFNLLVIVEL
jgi:hypothetical protein